MAFLKYGLYVGAFQPEAAMTSSMVTLALYGTLVVKSLITAFLASSAFLVGGNLKESLKVLLLLSTLPADFTSGKSEAPVMHNVGLHPLLRRAVKGLFVIFCAP